MKIQQALKAVSPKVANSNVTSSDVIGADEQAICTEATSLKRANNRYTSTLFILFGLGCLAVPLVNLLVDPLWYFKGNLFGDKNYTLNERVAKVNHYLKNPGRYNCFIFGSSRTALIDETQIAGHACFNFSYSGGQVEEYVAYAKWLEDKRPKPDQVIIALEDRYLMASAEEISLGTTVPDFIRNQTNPPNIFQAYLSWDVLEYSLERLWPGASYPLYPRFYDQKYLGKLEDTLPVYRPKIDQRHTALELKQGVEHYQEIRQTFSNADFIGYVPPFSPWTLASRNDDEIDHYLESVYQISRFIQPFYDFSIPNEVTLNTDTTYDGIHYKAPVQHQVVKSFNTQSPSFGLRVDQMTREDYFAAYRQALETVVQLAKQE